MSMLLVPDQNVTIVCGARRFHMLASWAALWSFVIVSFCGMAQAQRRPGRSSRVSPPMQIEPSSPVSNLFARAEDGIARRDWKFVIDCYQRIIDHPGGSLVAESPRPEKGDLIYGSAKRLAAKKLASLPPEALRAYRLVHDGYAGRLLKEARTSHNPDLLRELVRRFLLTSHGDEAVDLLASWMLDAGRPGESLRILLDLQQLVPDRDIPESLIRSKLIASYALLGRREEAEALSVSLQPGAEGVDISDINLAQSAVALSQFSSLAEVRSGDWPMVGGSPSRRGVMAPVVPVLVDDVPWRFYFSGSRISAWRPDYSDDLNMQLFLPVRQLVADHKRIFARTKRGCVALDAEDLSLIWEVDDEVELRQLTRAVVSAQQQRGGRAAQAVKLHQATYEDYVAGGISVAHDLVFTVSRGGTSVYAQAELDRDSGSAGVAPVPDARRNPEGTRILAYDVVTSELRWSRGRTGQAADPLGNVRFRSTPIPVGDDLWVAFTRRNDFFLAVMDPQSGALRHSVLLGALQIPETDQWFSLPPAFADGVVYVASGHGVLFAVNAHDHSVRWASQYSRGAGWPMTKRRDKESESFAWLSSPPIVAGNLVLLAPPERRELLAFSATSGHLQWRYSPENSAYVVGADPRYVWIAGTHVSCHSLVDGLPIWDVELPSAPVGRAVLSGDVVHVPLSDGLLSLDRETGDQRNHLPPPNPSEPLGNVLCLRDSIYAVNASRISKYPDIKRTYAPTLADHLADPADPVIAVRLAWLELLGGEPERALHVVETIGRQIVEADGDRTDAVARVWVEALLRHAHDVSKEGAKPGAVLVILERANEKARSPRDRLRCEQAVANEMFAVGRKQEAYRRLWRLGVGTGADQIVSLGTRVEGQARIAIAGRLREMAAELAPRQRSELEKFVAKEAQGARSRLAIDSASSEPQRELRAMADLGTANSVGRQALRELADHLSSRTQFEQAEQLLREAARKNDQPDAQLDGLLKLCQLYFDEQAAGAEPSGALLLTLGELDTRFAAHLIPEEMLATGKGSYSGERPTVATWVRQATKDFQKVEAMQRNARSVVASFTGDTIWSMMWNPAGNPPPSELPPSFIRFRTDHKAFVSDRVVVQGPDDVVQCFRAEDGELLWRTQLRLAGTFPSDRPMRTLAQAPSVRIAVSDAQTAVFAGADGLFAVGLMTGRRLWVRPYEFHSDAGSPVPTSVPMVAGYGEVASMPRAGWLTLMRLLDGSTLWERDLRNEPVDRIWMMGDRVVTADGARERVGIYERGTGKLVRRVLFSQPDPEQKPVALVLTGSVICGPGVEQGTDVVQAVDVETGEIAWSFPLDKPLAQIFKPQENYLGISTIGGRVYVLDAGDGSVLLEPIIAGGHAVLHAALLDGTLVVYHRPTPNAVTRSLSAIDIATGDELWTRSAVRLFANPGEPIETLGGHLPILFTLPGRGGRRLRSHYVALLDTRTGDEVGERAMASEQSVVNQFDGFLELLPASGVGVVFATEISGDGRTKVRRLSALRLQLSDSQAQQGT